ncbi:MAG: AMP-binding protein [Acidimicrobiales bacterium]
MNLETKRYTTDCGEATTSSRLRQVAADDPGRMAVRVDDAVLTYRQLDEAADGLAAAILADLGAGEQRVGLQCGGLIAMAVGAIGIARAGKVSVPIDPTAPVERVGLICRDVASPLLLSDTGIDSTEIRVPVAHPLEHRAPISPGGVDVAQGELASIVFTSGSTGMPKGIMVPSAARRDLRRKLTYEVAPGLTLGMITAGTVGFSEATMHFVVQFGCAIDGYEIRRLGLAGLGPWLLASRAHAIGVVPTIIRFLLPTVEPAQVFPDLKLVILTGETSTWEDIAALRPHLPADARIWNIFGLTETGGIAQYVIDQDTPIGSGPLPAGPPRPGIVVTLVGEDGRPVADGEVGEIVVESPDCNLGYWARPELTASVFTELPDGIRRVRTGDGGRWRPDGMLDHLGRLDHVVKISGNRVELGEVEATLRTLPGVLAAAAAAAPDAAGNNRLLAFVVPDPGAVGLGELGRDGGPTADSGLDGWALRRALARRLPGPLVPDRIHVVEAFPDLPNGKIDRHRLPELDRELQVRRPPERSMEPLEAGLAGLWAEILDVPSVGLDDDFFDLGGDSLRGARLFVELQRRLDLVRPVSLLVEASTVRRLARAIAAEAAATDILLPVQVGGSAAPLFAVHDGVGDVFFASRLSTHLGDDQPVYAIQPSLLFGDRILEGTFEQLAARYLDAVRAVRPGGPYLLYGASLGGLLAYEMARQLQAASEQVPLLAVGDSSAPGMALHRRAGARAVQLTQLHTVEATQQAAALGGRYGRHLVRRAREAPQRWRQRKQQDAVRTSLAAPAGAPSDAEALAARIMYTYGMVAHGYRPATPFDGSILLLRAGGPGDRPDRGWANAVSGRVNIVDVPGAHNQLGLEPWVGAISDALREALGEVATRR